MQPQPQSQMDVEDNNNNASFYQQQYQQQMQQQALQQQPQLVMPKFGPPEIDPSEITLLHVLGDGSFGSVYAGKCRQKDVAVKVLHKQDWDQKTIQAFKQEVEVMSKIFHPNINLFMGACTVPGKLMIVTELMRGDLETMFVDENRQLTMLQRLKIAKDAALGMLWLHSSNPQIIHRDLKASNLLLDDNLSCKICDFGLSQFKPKGKNLVDGKEGAKGTPLWMAPEVMMGSQFNEKADVYSFGLILWFLLSRKEPYEEFDDLPTFTHAICIQQHRPTIPQDCDPGLKDLIVRCWHPNPSVRPSMGDIVSRLDHIIVDYAIEDQLGRAFWKHNFLRKETVAWTDFLNAFSRFLDLIPATHKQFPMTYLLQNFPMLFQNSAVELEIRCLKAILAEESKTQGIATTATDSDESLVVNIEKFGNILKWFGPLVQSPFPPDGLSILTKIRLLLMEPWFHGDISTTESENRLLKKPEGTFLVRFSTSSPGCYTISKIAPKDLSIKHQKIQHKAGTGFEINGRVYNSIQELIKNESQALELYYSCGSSRFLSLFVEQKVTGYVDDPSLLKRKF